MTTIDPAVLAQFEQFKYQQQAPGMQPPPEPVLKPRRLKLAKPVTTVKDVTKLCSHSDEKPDKDEKAEYNELIKGKYRFPGDKQEFLSTICNNSRIGPHAGVSCVLRILRAVQFGLLEEHKVHE